MKIAVTADITKDQDVFQKAIPAVMQPMIEQYRKYPSNYYIFGMGNKPGPKMLGVNNLYNRQMQQLSSI